MAWDVQPLVHLKNISAMQTEEEIKAAPDGIGLHRFDSYCPIAERCPEIGRCQAWTNIFIDKKGKESEDEM